MACGDIDAWYRALVRSVPRSILAVFDRELTVVLADGAALDGMGESYAPGQRLVDIVPEDRRAEALAAARLAFRGRPVQLEYDSSPHRTWAVDVGPCVGDDGVVDGVVWVARDASEVKAVEEQLAHRALHDPLTGIANRELFMDRLQQALARVQRRETWVGVLFVDLDRLKTINDTLGHAAGDEVLVHVAHRIRRALRPADTVARFGGDEFVVLCEDLTTAGDAERLARRLAAVIARPLVVAGQEFRVSASVGVTASRDPLADPDVLVRDADAAMYSVKHRGRRGVVMFDEGMRMTPSDRQRVELGLRRALSEDRLAIFYQPQVRLGDLTVTAGEALLRWARPSGVADPHQFLTIAEEAGLMRQIGDWVIERVCRDVSAWPGELRASVNLSSQELADDELPGRAAAIAERAGVEPARLCFEVAESTLFIEGDRANEQLGALREAGFAVAIDDFGVGFSSLHHLRHLPEVDLLKLDRVFVAGLGESPRDAAVAASVVLLTNALGMLALGEGVETEDQADLLRAMGCDLGQGFWFGRPAPVDEFVEAVAA